MKILLILALLTYAYSCNGSSPSPVPMVKPYKSINLSWQPSPTPLVSYNVYRNKNNGAFMVLVQNLTTTSYSDTALQRKTTYCYKTTAQLATMESGSTNTWCVTTI